MEVSKVTGLGNLLAKETEMSLDAIHISMYILDFSLTSLLTGRCVGCGSAELLVDATTTLLYYSRAILSGKHDIGALFCWSDKLKSMNTASIPLCY